MIMAVNNKVLWGAVACLSVRKIKWQNVQDFDVDHKMEDTWQELISIQWQKT